MNLSHRIAAISESMTLAISSKAKAMQAEGIDVIDFGVGEPDFDTPQHIKQAAIDAINSGYTKYTPAQGSLELRQAVAEKLKRDNGLEYPPTQILLSCGAKHSLYNIIVAMCQEGDEVLIPSPYWLSYPEMVKAAGAASVFLPTDETTEFKITPRQLADAINPRTKLLVLNSPSNPTGSVYTPAELEQLANVILDSSIYVISDEIYETLVYDGTVHRSIASFGQAIKDRTIVVNGFSKSYAMTGWRLGYAAGPKEIMTAAMQLQSHSTSNPCSITQKAGLAALKGDQQCVQAMVIEFNKRRKRMVQQLNAIPGVTCLEPKGAFYTLPNISSYFGKQIKGRKIASSMDFAEAALEHARIAVVPGSAFGDDRVVRFSYATSLEKIEEGLRRMRAML